VIQPVQVDVVGAQPAQAVLELAHDRLAVAAAPFGSPPRSLSPNFVDTAWVRNARADGHAEIGRGRGFRRVLLNRGRRHPQAGRPPALPPQVGHRALRPVRVLGRSSPGVAAFEEQAGLHPVFIAQPTD
jgi:hypothetical protein